MITHIPTQEELAHLSSDVRAQIAAAYMVGVETGRVHPDLFRELGKKAVRHTFELALVRTSPETHRTEIALAERPAKDLDWPGQVHVHGVTVLPNDKISHDHDYDDSIRRILGGELEDSVRLTSDLNFLDYQHRRTPRGPEITLIHWAEAEQISPLPTDTQFYDAAGILRNPPEAGIIVERHDGIIARVAAQYEALKQPQP